MQKIFVIALGGSIIAPKEFDIAYLKNLKLFLNRQVKKGNRFLIIVGGGFVCRHYVGAASKISKLSAVEQDLLGIASIKLNAFFIKTILGNIAFFDEVNKLDIKKHKVVLACKGHPGQSSDGIALEIAFRLKQKQVIVIGKPDHVYTKDPDVYKDAKPIKELALRDYLKMIPNKWQPCLSSPIDPTAARFAKSKKIQVIVAGKNLKNLENIIEGKSFLGTTCY